MLGSVVPQNLETKPSRLTAHFRKASALLLVSSCSPQVPTPSLADGRMLGLSKRDEEARPLGQWFRTLLWQAASVCEGFCRSQL